MSFPSCASCVVVLNQQHEQQISHQNQDEDETIHHRQNASQGKTVVENGRVVVKQAESPNKANVCDI
ncbi:hypothetical protein Nos7524_4395 [Nostoc sp. PCC 7524]|uniref:hypothetical protein n=1 Tax=Nostoc sp. (strain ATCC 29411 / PCC 7524) TaxID=28072 RepID=UPI00029ED19F|nr:hypothetical protein [Nostoc sp. PCC 7524]AFY50154.1 hypothetical protein Nos7524_4395 [Nostoc sp. PCC 7524]